VGKETDSQVSGSFRNSEAAADAVVGWPERWVNLPDGFNLSDRV
jgi:hypothetical protein